MAGKEFVAYIDDFLVRSKDATSILGNTRSSIRLQWQHKRIDAYVSRLENFQSSLTLATTLSLRTRAHNNHAEVLHHLRSLQAGGDDSQKKSDELTASLRIFQDLMQQESGANLGALQEHMDWCRQDIKAIRKSVIKTREEEILRWLDFRQKRWRFEEVEEAHQKTFKWIFRPSTTDKPWHDLGTFLSAQDITLPYFINGKAGSGKSTLMKFITTHVNTAHELRRWANGHRLLMLPYFFWNVGAELQKNHSGMLRALLHKILEQYYDLIPAAFPHLYIGEKHMSDDEAPTYAELKRAFDILRARSASFLRICILIDGIDEFEGDHRDMSTFLCSLASASIKVIVSSRPINACLNVFRHCPSLRLQDLTKNDMRIVIQDKLGSHPMMTTLEDDAPRKARLLVAEIQDKAEGVFLWTRLVAELVLRGLEDGDDLDDLLPKVRALPSDLRDLYARMMQKMSSDYQIQASQMFQIVEWWRTNSQGKPLELTLLSFVILPPQYALQIPSKPRAASEHNRFAERIEARIRSRCCGLLEVREVAHQSIFWPASPIVTYLHRTVAEFLTSGEIWEDMLRLTKPSMFNPSTNIASGILATVKTLDPKEHAYHKGCQTLDTIKRTLYMGDLLQISIDLSCRTTTFDEMYRATYMRHIVDAMLAEYEGQSPELSQEPEQGKGQQHDLRSGDLSEETTIAASRTNWCAGLARSCVVADAIQARYRDQLANQANIFSVAAYTGCYAFLRLAEQKGRLEGLERLILFALGSWINREIAFEVRRETLRFLLGLLYPQSLVNVETSVCRYTLWEHAMMVAFALLNPVITAPASACEGGAVRSRIIPAWKRKEKDSVDLDQAHHDSLGLREYWSSTSKGLQARVSQSRPANRTTTQIAYPLTEHVDRPIRSGHFDKPLDDTREVLENFEDLVLKEVDRGRRSRTSEHRSPILDNPELLGMSNFLDPSDEDEAHNPWRWSRDRSSDSQDLQRLVMKPPERSVEQEAGDLLRLFLSVAQDPRKLVYQHVKTSRFPNMRPLGLIRKVLRHGSDEPAGWAVGPEYDFLRDLVA